MAIVTIIDHSPTVRTGTIRGYAVTVVDHSPTVETIAIRGIVVLIRNCVFSFLKP